MAYNLPPPWDPGYALPDNVRDEGLQRRGFVTKQMPRGTYDQPNVDSGGYVLPQYVWDEGYGQGTFTTKWEPRGQYDGPKIPHWLNDRPRVLSETRRRGGGRNIKIAAPIMVRPNDQGSATAMSGVPEELPPASIRIFAVKAADRLIAYAAGVTPALRTQALRSAMDGIDKTLWKRTQDIAAQLVRTKGLTPGQAFRPALERALAAGVTAELIKVGQTSAVPQDGSLRGLGCNGGRRAALGATGTMITVGKGTNTFTSGTTTLAASYVRCPGFSWDGAAWVRTKAGATDVIGPPGGCAAPTDHRDAPAGAMFQAGPFVLPYQDGATITFTPGSITPEQKAAVLDAMAKATATDVLLNPPVTPYGGVPSGMPFVPDKDTLPRMFGTDGMISKKISDGAIPLFKVKDPNNGNYWGLKLVGLGTPDKPRFSLKLVTWEVNWLGKLIDSVVELIGKIYNFLEDLVCDLVNTPGASTAAATMGPNGLVAGVGMEIIKGTACQRPIPPPPPPPVPTEKPFPILPVAIAGAAVLAVVIISSKKKKHP